MKTVSVKILFVIITCSISGMLAGTLVGVSYDPSESPGPHLPSESQNERGSQDSFVDEEDRSQEENEFVEQHPHEITLPTTVRGENEQNATEPDVDLEPILLAILSAQMNQSNGSGYAIFDQLGRPMNIEDLYSDDSTTQVDSAAENANQTTSAKTTAQTYHNTNAVYLHDSEPIPSHDEESVRNLEPSAETPGGNNGTGIAKEEEEEVGDEDFSHSSSNVVRIFNPPPLPDDLQGSMAKVTFYDSHNGQERAMIPGKNLIKEIQAMDADDLAPFLDRCGTFPACHLRTIKSADIINQVANSYDMEIGEVIKHDPYELANIVTVDCDPTSVSIVTAFAIVLAIVIVISNIVIITVTVRTKALRKPHGYFKISLAVADLLAGALVLPNMSSNMVRFIHFNNSDIEQLLNIRRLEPLESEAAFFGVSAVLSQVVTIYSVLLLSVDSFLSIRWPMQYRFGDLLTPKRSLVLIAIVWIFACSVSAFPILAKEYVRYGLSYITFSFVPILDPIDANLSNEEAFWGRYIHVIVYGILVFGIPFIATWTLTLMTAYHSRGMLKNMNLSRKKTRTATEKFEKLEKDIQRTVAIVLVMLTITIFPIVICTTLLGVTTHNNPLCLEQGLVSFFFASFYILICGSFVNVIVYNACHKEFRRATFDLLCDIFTFLFARVCPDYCDLKAARGTSSSRSKSSSSRTRGTTINSDKRNKNTIKSKPARIQANQSPPAAPAELSVSSHPFSNGEVYERSNDQSESTVSEAHSSSHTVSTIDSSTTSRNRSISSDSSNSFNVIHKAPAKRTVSYSSVFTSSSNNPMCRFSANMKR